MDGARVPAGHRLRMADLVARTGVAAQTIRYYVNQGLLPKPRKSARNMAWYSEQHVELITLVRALQKEHFLPLRAIHAALHESDEYPLTPHQRSLIAMARKRIEARREGQVESSPEAVARQLGIDAEDLAELRSHRLLSDGGEDSAGDAVVLRLWALMRSHGLSRETGFRPRDLGMAHDVVDLLFDHELQLFSERLRSLPMEQVDGVLSTVVPAVIQLIGVLNERRIARFVSRFTDHPDHATET